MNAPVRFGEVALRGSIVTGLSQGVKIALQFLSVVISAVSRERLCVAVPQFDVLGRMAQLAPRILAENWMGT